MNAYRFYGATRLPMTVDEINGLAAGCDANVGLTIEAGKISGKSPEGRTISGSCKDGARMVVQEKNGVPLLLPMPSPTPKKK